MDHGLEIIPISSHGRPLSAGLRTHVALLEERKGAGWGVTLVAGWMLLIVAIAAHGWVQNIGNVRRLAPAERAPIYERSLGEAEVACTTPEARTGALRDQCLGQAELLTLFPECDGRCQRLVEAILPHARR
jgi:hypothetical protein